MLADSKTYKGIVQIVLFNSSEKSLSNEMIKRIRHQIGETYLMHTFSHLDLFFLDYTSSEG